jgi:hypothetical protein
MAGRWRNFLYWVACILAVVISMVVLAFASATVGLNYKWLAITSAVAVLLVLFSGRAWGYVLRAVVSKYGTQQLKQTHQLDQKGFNDHTNKIINAAISDGVMPNDAICATARALGVLVAFTARREHMDFNELLVFAQQETTEYTKSAEGFMQDNRGLWDRYGLAADRQNVPNSGSIAKPTPG